MRQKTFASGPALQNMVKHTLLLAALCLLSACDNGAPAPRVKSSAMPSRTVVKARRWWCCRRAVSGWGIRPAMVGLVLVGIRCGSCG